MCTSFERNLVINDEFGKLTPRRVCCQESAPDQSTFAVDSVKESRDYLPPTALHAVVIYLVERL